MKRLRDFEQVEPYLTVRALEMISEYERVGVRDRDLAFALVEAELKEEELFELPEREDGTA
jgi:hypothetical protein